jgi:hypothetical protein
MRTTINKDSSASNNNDNDNNNDDHDHAKAMHLPWLVSKQKEAIINI